MALSTIEWTEKTWNPVTGCKKISQGCKNCYAEIMSKRLKSMGQLKYQQGFEPMMHPQDLTLPSKWRKPTIVFVNSMSDLFLDEFPLEYIKEVFRVMNENPKHTFQVLTKRAERLKDVSEHLNWTENIWMGVSVEDATVKDRIGFLRNTPAKIKFLSIEPLIGPLGSLNLKGINWVIVGGESGWKSRPVKIEWVRDIRDNCVDKNVPFFFKQWGGTNKKKAGRVLDGRTWDECLNGK